MSSRLRVPSPAMVVALIALFASVGGIGYAASKIGTNDLRAGAVTAKKLHKNAVATGKIRKGAVKTAKIAAGAVGPDQSQGLVTGAADVSLNTVSAPSGGFLNPVLVLADIPTMGEIQLIYCGNYGQNGQMRVRVLSDDDSQPFTVAARMIAGKGPAGTTPAPKFDFTSGSFSQGGGEPLIAEPQGATPGIVGTVGTWDYDLIRGEDANAQGAHVMVSGHNSSTSFAPNGTCRVRATTIMEG